MGRARSRTERPTTVPPPAGHSAGATKSVIDLTQRDRRAVQARSQSVKPTPLSPAFGPRNTAVPMPRDPKAAPAYIFQQLALARNKARVRPSFSSAFDGGGDRPESDTDNDDDDTDTDADADADSDTVADSQADTPSPDEKHLKAKRLLKEKAKHDKARSEKEERKAKLDKEKHTPKPKEKAAHVRDDTKAKTRKEVAAGTHHETKVSSRKRKRDEDAERAAKRMREAESLSVEKLRESLPAVILDRVSSKLQREMVQAPTEMTVLLTAARDTMIHLARQQILQTELSYQTLQGELLRILKQQNRRLARFEGRREPTASSTDSSSSGDEDSDDSEDDDDDESHKSWDQRLEI